MDDQEVPQESEEIQNFGKSNTSLSLSELGYEPESHNEIEIPAEGAASLTKSNDHLSTHKSTESITENPSYFDDSDYSLNIASAVATILAGDVGDDGHPELVSPSPSKRTLKQKKSKHKIRRSKSSLEKNLNAISKTKLSSKHQDGHGCKTSQNSTDLTITLSDILPVRNTVHSGAVLKPSPPIPLAKNPNMVDVNVYLARIQEYINRLGYHRQGEPKIHVHSHMSMKHQTDTARLLIRAGEPIKCLHALVLAIHFTNCTPLIERFTINFKSNFDGKEYKHVVLGIYMYGFYGSLGISRDVGLQDKPVAFPRLSDLMNEYKRSYEESGHILVEVKIGGIVPHEPHSLQQINWKLGTIGNKAEPVQDMSEADRIAKSLRLQMGAACLRQLRAEISPPICIPTSEIALLTSLDMHIKMPAPRFTTVVKKSTSKTRALGTNLPVKKKSKN